MLSNQFTVEEFNAISPATGSSIGLLNFPSSSNRLEEQKLSQEEEKEGVQQSRRRQKFQ